MKITFYGAAKTVTGSKHLITTEKQKNILLDCGLFQSKGSETEYLNRHFGFEPSIVDYMILSHAHTDHAGNIPHLVKEGFTGPIYATPATIDLCKIMLMDSAHIQESDIAYLNKKRIKKGEAPLTPIYTEADVTIAIQQFVPVKYNEGISIDDHIRFHFTDAGHILGSAAVNLEIDENGTTKKIFFSGDVGRYNDIILRAPQEFPQADIILCESTYGNRLHEHTEDAEARLIKIVQETCVERKGKLIIPAFSLGRTQEVVYALDRAHTAGKMPHIPVYIDSPLAISATEIMRKHTESFNPEILEYMQQDTDPFGYDEVFYIRDVADSKSLNDFPEPCIIISASGMMEAGRIKHHIKNNIEDTNNTILIVGYVTPHSLGGKLKDGSTEVRIFGELYTVKAKIEIIDSYSAHADYEELLRYLLCQDPKLVSKLFLVHGEDDALFEFRNKLTDVGFGHIFIPDLGETYEI